MPQAAILSFCADLTRGDVSPVPLFKVSVDPGCRLQICYLQTYETIQKLVGRDNTTLGVVQFYPWSLVSLLAEVGEADFLRALTAITSQSSIFVERIEPC